MNKYLRQLFTAVIALFVVLGMSTTIITAIRANSLSSDPRNARALYQEYGAPRGAILASDGTILAQSTPVNDVFSYQRSYTNGPVYAPVTGFFSVMHMAMKHELGNAEPYFAATSPVLDLTVIRPDDAPHILACFDEADEGIGISENEPLGFRYNPKQVVKLMGQRYLVGPVIFHRFDEDGNFASLTMGDMYTIQKYLEAKSVTLMIDRDKLTCICID